MICLFDSCFYSVIKQTKFMNNQIMISW